MAEIYPFSPYYFSSAAGKLDDLVFPCHGSVPPMARETSISKNPYSIASVLWDSQLGPVSNDRSVKPNPGQALRDLISQGVLQKHPRRALFAWLQEFSLPESDEKLLRKSIIGLGEVHPYEAEIVFRHERTFASKRANQLMFTSLVHANLDPILMLYPDLSFTAEIIIDEVMESTQPMMTVCDESGVKNILYEIAEPCYIEELKAMFMQKQLLIADGHHRYEAALDFRAENPSLEAAQYTLMAFTNSHSDSLRTLATHRVVGGIENFALEKSMRAASELFTVMSVPSLEDLKTLFAKPAEAIIRIGVVATESQPQVFLLTQPKTKYAAVESLHGTLLPRLLGAGKLEASPAPVVNHVRGLDNAVSLVWTGHSQIGFLMEPTPFEHIFQSGLGYRSLLPQKSTDFFPKMLTGLLVRNLDRHAA